MSVSLCVNIWLSMPPVNVYGLSWCICVHGNLDLCGSFMPRSPSRCLACSLVSVELGIRTLRMFLLKPDKTI